MARAFHPKPANDNGGLLARAKAALPGWRASLIGALGWGAGMALSAQAGLFATNRAETFNFWPLTLLFFLGGALAWPLALALVRFSALGRRAEVWFSATMVFLPTATIGLTAGLFSLVYRSFYAQYHAEALSKLWIIQQVFTTGSAFYQFAVVGLRLYLPYAALLVLVVAFVMAHRRAQRPQPRFFHRQRKHPTFPSPR